MSHNVMVEGVVFDDLDSLEKAFEELKGSGLLSANAVFHKQPFMMRGYGGRNEQVPMGIQLPSERYDIGFRQGKDGWQPYFEHGFAPQGIAAERDAKTLEGQNCYAGYGVGAVGRLAQRYRAIQLERNARRNGMQTRRSYQANGKVSLEIIHR